MFYLYTLELRGEKFSRTNIGSYSTWQEAEAARAKLNAKNGRQIESVITTENFNEVPTIKPATLGLVGYSRSITNPATFNDKGEPL